MNCLERLRGGLVVSVQPVEDSPLNKIDIIVAMAMAAVNAGAAGLRIEGVSNVTAVCDSVAVPVIGIVKQTLPGTDVRITPTVEAAQALCDAGADIIAVDMTLRPRISPLQPVIDCVLKNGALLMADCATEEDASAALNSGASILGSTLSGYTAETESASDLPDLALVKRLRSLAGTAGFVMAEGRYNSPELAAAAIQAGADCVTVGSAITRLEHVVGWFDSAVKDCH